MLGRQVASHIPVLNGVRFCAMTVVFLHHVGAPQIIPGRFGVTTFFFLSGYLITTLLRREFQDSGTISLRFFYLRRLLRIFPPMWVVIAFAGILAAFGVIQGFGPGALLGMLANFTNYVVLAGGEIPYELLPLWSLAVEEHFYLLFPAAYLLMLRSGASPRQQALMLLAAAAALLLWRVVLQTGGASYERLATASDTRMDSLLFGAMLAIVLNPVLDRPLRVGPVGSMAILGVAGMMLAISFRMVYEPGGSLLAFSYTLQGVALAPLFYIAIMRHDWVVFRWLDWRLVSYLGTISYTMYLVHLPLFALFDRFAPDMPAVMRAVVLYVLTAIAAHISYVLMERPLGALRSRLHGRRPTTEEVRPGIQRIPDTLPLEQRHLGYRLRGEQHTGHRRAG